MIREANAGDLDGLLALYAQLHGDPPPEKEGRVAAVWREILSDSRQHVVVAEEDGMIVSSCVCVIVPNLTHGQRPYALIENVVTDAAHRGRGLASSCLAYAKAAARRENCYKIMLLTGSREDGTLRFYERAGYNWWDKTGFVQWLA